MQAEEGRGRQLGRFFLIDQCPRVETSCRPQKYLHMYILGVCTLHGRVHVSCISALPLASPRSSPIARQRAALQQLKKRLGVGGTSIPIPTQSQSETETYAAHSVLSQSRLRKQA